MFSSPTPSLPKGLHFAAQRQESLQVFFGTQFAVGLHNGNAFFFG